jgi:hypothetical protein
VLLVDFLGLLRILDALSRSLRGASRSLKIEKETTPGVVRWTRVDGVTLHDGTPRAHLLEGGVVISLIEF